MGKNSNSNCLDIFVVINKIEKYLDDYSLKLEIYDEFREFVLNSFEHFYYSAPESKKTEYDLHCKQNLTLNEYEKLIQRLKKRRKC